MMDVTAPDAADEAVARTPEAELEEEPPRRAASRRGRLRRWLERPWPPARVFEVVSTVLALGITTLVMMAVVHLNPLNPAADLILDANTPTGGDMGAHVWGPAFLRDHLLPNFQLNGWSMDWYAGMPVYRFYMLTPALAMVALDVLLPYGVAFKIVAISGLVFLPTCCWAFGKLASFRSPIPQLFAFAGMAFALQESYSIYGGNLKSTMAGEFSFSIALSLGVLGLGLLAKAMQTGRYRNWAAIVLALAIVSHGIVAIYVALAAAIVVLVHLDNMRRFKFGALLALAVVALSAFWIGPFLGNHDFMTDMKYGGRPDGASDSYWDMFFPFPDPIDVLVTGLAVVGFVASVARRHLTGTALGVIGLCTVALVYLTRDSLPIIGLLWNPRLLPLLYLVEFLLAMVGAVEIGSVVAAAFHDRRLSAPGGTVSRATTFGVAAVFVCFTFAFFFEVLPGGTRITEHGQTVYAWGPLHKNAHPDDEDAYQKAQGSGWSRYNFEGYEGRPKYPEYYDVVQSMTEIGARDGCGRALWENNGDNGEYGTTMALMLLPFWTDGCITSMEGLFFEASGTTPYHFLTAAAMSAQSSNPVRELRYQNNDADIGVRHLQSLGVRYAMVRTDEAKREAREQEELVLLDTVGPWEIYRVADSEVVVPLQVQPVVVAGREGDQRERNLELGASWFQQPDEWAAIPADDGPESWQRISVEVDESRAVPERDRPADDPDTRGKQVDIVVPTTPIDPVVLPEIEVSDVEMDQEGLSFRVDQVGVPVLVKVSYFPNWEVSGAEGPFRIAPNFMVVVPTEQDVQLTYGRSGSDLLFYLMTAAGIALVIFLRLKGDVDLDGPARTDDTATSTGPEPPSEDDTDGAFPRDRPPAWAGAPPPVWAGGPASPSHSPADAPAPPAGDIAVGPEVGPPGSSPPSPPSPAPSPPAPAVGGPSRTPRRSPGSVRRRHDVHRVPRSDRPGPSAPAVARPLGAEEPSMSALDQIVKAYDVRGTVPDQLNEEVARALGVAFARYAPGEEILVARDMRPSGVGLVNAFTDGLCRQGIDVVDLGLASSDLLYYAAGARNRAGAIFTASHNPAQYNGVKFCLAGARPVGPDGLGEIKAMASTVLDGHGPADAPRPGRRREADLLPDFVEHVLSFIDLSALRPLRVVADTANGMGGLVVPAVFERLPGVELEVLYGELDGTFPNHPADPLQPANQRDLRARVTAGGFDLGLAFDGDADRVFVVDEQGIGLSGSTTTAMLAASVLRANPGATVLHNLICSKAVPEVIREHGGVPVRTKVGHSFIKQVMADTGAVFGGEHSAHYYFARNYRADSGLIATVHLLEEVGRAAQELSIVRKPFERYSQSGEINTQVDDTSAVLHQVSAAMSAYDQDDLDGLTVDAGSWWCNLRPSNTEPLLRLNLEAETRDECDARVAEILGLLTSV